MACSCLGYVQFLLSYNLLDFFLLTMQQKIFVKLQPCHTPDNKDNRAKFTMTLKVNMQWNVFYINASLIYHVILSSLVH